MSRTADVCLIMEGTYPYTYGGVANWTHDLIQQFPDKTFHLLCITSPKAVHESQYELADNVVGITNWRLQTLPEKGGQLSSRKGEEFAHIFSQWMEDGGIESYREILQWVQRYPEITSMNTLLESKFGWHLMQTLYNRWLPNGEPFLDFYWTWRIITTGMLSLMANPLPKARAYHALSTGYAGLALARASIETGHNGLLTEHGIYTNERNIEIASAPWLADDRNINLSSQMVGQGERTIKRFMEQFFKAAAKTSYQASEKIVSLFKDNTPMQLADGAPTEKLQIIPNTIDITAFKNVKRKRGGKPVVAMVGRIVPIKDVKTFIRMALILKQAIPDVEAHIIGDMDVDPIYVQECRDLVENLKLQDTVKFIDRTPIRTILASVDVMILTSLSESQPLVILEAGAAKIPFVATNVGFCREMILGSPHEKPAIGAGGAICPLASPTAVAKAVEKLLKDSVYYNECAEALHKRIKTHYRREQQQQGYAALYARISV